MRPSMGAPGVPARPGTVPGNRPLPTESADFLFDSTKLVKLSLGDVKQEPGGEMLCRSSILSPEFSETHGTMDAKEVEVDVTFQLWPEWVMVMDAASSPGSG